MRTCVIADESAVVRKICGQLVADQACLPIEAATLDELCEILAQERPTYCLLDANFCGSSAPQIVRQCFRDVRELSTEFVVMVIRIDDEFIAMSRRAGAAKFLVKPFDGVDIARALKREAEPTLAA